MRRSIALFVLAIAAGLAAGTASGTSERASGSLPLNATVPSSYRFDPSFCPPGVGLPAECVRFTGSRTIRGLGAVTTTFTKILPGDDPTCTVIQNNTAVIAVAGKGTLEVTRDGKICTPPAPLTVGPYAFTISGGTGKYAGASGTLEFRQTASAMDGACRCGSAQETWTGTIVVPGHEFDLTAPVLSGAKSKTVRVRGTTKRARVRFAVSARDAVDGSRPVACSPRAGSFFKLGRTRVTCSSADLSGNASTARFTITVKRG